MNADTCDNDADLWLNLLSRLQQGQREAQTPPIQWTYPLDQTIGREAAWEQWVHHDLAHKVSIQLILRQWIESGIVDDSSEELRWFFAARFAPAIDLVARLTYSKDNRTPDATWTTFFPFPRRPASEVLKLLLDEWWNYMGSNLFFDASYDDFQKSK